MVATDGTTFSAAGRRENRVEKKRCHAHNNEGNKKRSTCNHLWHMSAQRQRWRDRGPPATRQAPLEPTKAWSWRTALRQYTAPPLLHAFRHDSPVICGAAYIKGKGGVGVSGCARRRKKRRAAEHDSRRLTSMRTCGRSTNTHTHTHTRLFSTREDKTRRRS